MKLVACANGHEPLDMSIQPAAMIGRLERMANYPLTNHQPTQHLQDRCVDHDASSNLCPCSMGIP